MDFRDIDALNLQTGSSEWFKFETDKEVKFRMIGAFIIVNSYYVPSLKKSIKMEVKTEAPEHLQELIREKKVRKSVKLYTYAVDRSDGNIKKMEMPISAFMQINDLRKDDDWGFEGLPDFDLKIKKTGQDMKTKYVVNPSPNRADLDKAILDEFSKMKPMPEQMKEWVKDDEKKLAELKPVESTAEVKDEEIDINDLPF